jgi:hypothetical protein
VLADKAYSSKAIRNHLRRRGIGASIPVKADRAANRRKKDSRGGRLPRFDPQGYKQRNTVERCVNKAQAVPRRGDPLRQAGLHVPGHGRHRHQESLLRDLTKDP